MSLYVPLLEFNHILLILGIPEVSLERIHFCTKPLVSKIRFRKKSPGRAALRRALALTH